MGTLTRTARRRHSAQRCKERFDIVLSENDLDDLEREIETKRRATMLADQYETGTQLWNVYSKIHDRYFTVAYHVKHRCIATVLPDNTYFRSRQNAHKNKSN